MLCFFFFIFLLFIFPITKWNEIVHLIFYFIYELLLNSIQIWIMNLNFKLLNDEHRQPLINKRLKKWKKKYLILRIWGGGGEPRKRNILTYKKASYQRCERKVKLQSTLKIGSKSPSGGTLTSFALEKQTTPKIFSQEIWFLSADHLPVINKVWRKGVPGRKRRRKRERGRGREREGRRQRSSNNEIIFSRTRKNVRRETSVHLSVETKIP